MASAVRYALRRLRRGWRSGELVILTLALVVAVAAAAAVGVFTERVRTAIASQAGDALGADLVATGRDPPPEAFLAEIAAAGARAVKVTNLPSVLFAGEASALAAVKAADAGYPLRGSLRIADEPFGVERATAELPAAGEAWADQRLWSELALAPGVRIQIGVTALRVSRVLTYEPDRGGGFVDLAPRLLIHPADLAATGLVQPASRVQYQLMVSGPPAALARVRALAPPPGYRLVGPEDARPELRTALDRAGKFLDIAVLAAALLSAAAVALCARGQGLRLRDEIALLKCLGAGQAFIATALLASLLLLGFGAGVAGALVGYGAQALLGALLAGLLGFELPPGSLAPLAGAFALGLVMLLGFAAPPILQARRVPPIRIFQRDLAPGPWSWGAGAIAVATLALLFHLQTGEAQLAGYVFGGVLATIVVLALLALALVAALAPLRRRGGAAWRFGLANIARRRGASVVQAVALGQALLALLLIGVCRQDLLETWRDRLEPGTPNQFLINVQPAQIEPLKQFFARRGEPAPALMPMARARLTGINGKTVSADAYDDPETRRWINREFNLSWADTLRDDNRLVEGQWWGEAGRGQPWLSADRYAVERLGLKIGDKLRFALADLEVELTVHNLREVDWDSFRPNFFLLTPPGVLDAAPAIWLTSFYLPPERRGLLRELVREFPNVTALDLDAMMAQVRGIMDRIVRAVEFIFLFTLAAGITVLLAAIEATRDERVRETAVLRALGARTRAIVQGLVGEYAVLGLLAGLVAAIAAQVITWLLAELVFKIPYGPRPLLWLLGGGLGAGIVTLLGWISLRGTIATPPHQVLRSGA